MDKENYDEPILEPKTVSTWLNLPGSQLPRETVKIIGQPAQPARKKGGSACYSIQDALLMKLGRKLMEMGVTPHRVRACVEKVREEFYTVITGYATWPGDEYADYEMEASFYIVGRETSKDFKVVLVPEDMVGSFITEGGLADVEWRAAIRAGMQKRIDDFARNNPRPKLDISMLRPVLPGAPRPPQPKKVPVKSYTPEDMDKWAEEGYDLIDRMDPGSPAIVQNVTRFVQDQHAQLLKHIEKTVGIRSNV